ncbi:hypothetical protein ACFLTU_06870 [Bacteroidota bacterium]
MNIIVNGFVNEFLRPIVRDFIKIKNVEKCYFIDTQIDAADTDVITYLDFRDVTFGKYPVDWQDIIPLNKSLIESMIPCEAVVLKMMERIEQHAGRLSYDERKEIYYRHLRFWNHIIEKNNIQLFLSSNLPHENYDYVIFSLCKLKGINTRFFHQAKTDYMMIVEDWIPYQPDLKSNYEKILKEYSGIDEIELEKRSENLLSSQLNKETDPVPYALTVHYSKEKRKRLKREKRQRMLLKLNSASFYKRIFNGKNIKIAFYRFIGKRFKNIESRRLRRLYSRLSVKPDFEKKFIYFPLHRQPELTTSALAGCFVDQKLIVDILSASVPSDFMIYVKENPLQNTFNRSKKFYREISGMRNVEFVNLKTDTFGLINNSVAVATASGTAGWEALFRGKPVMIFGNIYYEYASGVFKCGSVMDCKNAIDKILRMENQPDLRSLKLYLKAMESVTSPGYYSHVYQHGSVLDPEENHTTLVNYLLSKTSK